MDTGVGVMASGRREDGSPGIVGVLVGAGVAVEHATTRDRMITPTFRRPIGRIGT